MTSEAERSAIAAFPELRRLLDLRDTGWRFQRTEVEVRGVRTWPDGWADAVAVRYVTDAFAVRCDPNGAVVWRGVRMEGWPRWWKAFWCSPRRMTDSRQSWYAALWRKYGFPSTCEAAVSPSTAGFRVMYANREMERSQRASCVHNAEGGETGVVSTDTTRLHVCFVCTGNICRSPMAALVFAEHLRREGLDDRVRVTSSGTGPWHVGEEIDSRAGATLREHGYPTAHIAAQVGEMHLDADLLVALDSGHARDLRELVDDPERIRLLRSFSADAKKLDVPDPYYAGGAGSAMCSG